MRPPKPRISDPPPGNGFANEDQNESDNDKRYKRCVQEQRYVSGQQIKGTRVHRRISTSSQ